MSDPEPSYDLAAIRDLLLAAFTPDELRALFVYAANPNLRPLEYQLGSGEGLASMVDRAITYCRNQALLPELLAEVARANPGQYANFASRLPAAPPALDGARYARAREAYLAALRKRYNVIETHAFTEKAQDEQVGNPRRLPLLGDGGVYVPLAFDPPASGQAMGDPEGRDAPGKGARQRGEQGPEEQEPLDLAEVLALPGHLAIVGDAGCGKTTVLHVIASALAAGEGQGGIDLPEAEGPRPIPVLLPLRLFEQACLASNTYGRKAAGLLNFVDEWFAGWCAEVDLPPRFLADHLRAGRAWFLLDALDEVAEETHRETMRNAIQELAGLHPGTRLIVTARVAAYRSTRLDDRFSVVTVRDLDGEQRGRMVRAIYRGLALPDAGRRAGDLVGRFEGSEALRELGRTPVMVWTAAVIHALRGELPEGRAALYDAYVDILLKQSFKRTRYDTAAVDELAGGQDWPLPDRRHYLTYAAFQAHRLLEAHPERRAGRRAILGEEELADRVLARYFCQNLGYDQREARQRARKFLTLMAERSGLLYESPQGYSIGDHMTMQEFLAGCYLGEHYAWEDPAGYEALLREKVGRTWWREVFLLAAGYLAERPGFAARTFLQQVGEQGQEPAERLAALALAARGLLQLRARQRRPTWYGGLARGLANGLYQQLYAEPADAPATLRHEAGLALGLLYGLPGEEGGLEDPRFAQPAVRPGGHACGLPVFVAIEGGDFWMVGDDSEQEDEHPRHRVTLDGYALARYPTTNAMYARFVAAGGYRDARWWAEAIADGYWGEERAYRYGNLPRLWEDPRFNNPAQPVVGVSWYEAVAYCAWLTAELDDGRTYRLPTEAEWERAARGGHGHRYPWGAEWREDHCNSKEAGLGAPSPVGVFPQGAAAGGLEDMVGNVYEWCQDWYGADYYEHSQDARNPIGSKAGTSRIVRGGGWSSTGAQYCRCGYRNWGNPRFRLNHWGFRCARASSSVP